MEQIPCPDGYLLDSRSPLADGHHALNEYLVRVEDAGWQTALKEINGIRNKARKLAIWRALLERMAWLSEHHRETVHASPLRGLAERIEKWKLDLSERDLIDLLDGAARASGFLAPYTPIPFVMAYTEEKGLSRDLAEAIRRFRTAVYDLDYSINQSSLQLFRSRLDMLAWRDEWTEIDLNRCWSEVVRRDFRAMQGAERESWRQLLYSIRGDEVGRPHAGWLKQSHVLVSQIGPADFRERLLCWLEPLKPGQSQRLSREGSFILRAFLWRIESLQDPPLLAKAAEVTKVEFKPKSNGQKVVRAAAEAVGQPDPTAKPLVNPPSLPDLVGRSLAAAFAPGASPLPPWLANRVQISGTTIYVRGDLDSYQIDITSSTVTRQSDGAEISVSTRAAAAPVGFAFPALAGVTELLRKVVVLAEDSKNRAALSTVG